ncbi:biotin carboxylase N-terminal domain-containing protein [Methylocapsa palsarum]|nr:biotin carboxylase N-terminal domain-containing protein [Methylocapsa palsarum]
MFSKILIANRGEIACRIIRTARRLGVATVAVSSQADRDAMHVALADEAWPIGPAPAQDSYLAGEKIIAAAKAAGAQAIHPGYGFLAENADFAQSCAEADLVFIGPPPEAIRAMGDKSTAKTLMERAGVPLLPGYHGSVQESRLLEHEAARIGYPVLIKPSAGGGGKGMKIATGRSAFAAQLASAQREAMAAFGDARVLVEKYLPATRHVEVQIFADAQGNCVHLFDRDCSIQRRHQKIIEEAPASGLSPDLRRRMGEAAVAAAKAVGYVGAGTIEFLVPADAGAGEFYFLEMNTRLQVEHTVTEFITGLDLVEWQLRVAAGGLLPLEQARISCAGHAIEARLYAEDPEREFLPQAARLERLDFPAPAPDIRVDAGFRAGDEIPIFYDPLIAKIIAFGPDRAAAIARLRGSLDEIRIAGPAANLDFLRAIVSHEEFANAAADTSFIARNQHQLLAARPPAANEILAIAVIGLLAQRVAEAQAGDGADRWSPWRNANGWRLNEDAEEKLVLKERAREDSSSSRTVVATFLRDGWRLATQDGAVYAASGDLAADGALTVNLDGRRRAAVWMRSGSEIRVFVKGESARRFNLIDPARAMERPDTNSKGQAAKLVSPLPGRIAAILVEPGAKVELNQPVLILEAMKMEHALCALGSGIVRAFQFKIGDQVAEGVELVTIEPA